MDFAQPRFVVMLSLSKHRTMNGPREPFTLRQAQGERVYSAVHVLTVSDFEYRHLVQFVVNKVNNPVLTLPYPVTIHVTCELFRSRRPGIAGEPLNSLHDALPVCFGAERLNFLCR